MIRVSWTVFDQSPEATLAAISRGRGFRTYATDRTNVPLLKRVDRLDFATHYPRAVVGAIRFPTCVDNDLAVGVVQLRAFDGSILGEITGAP